MPSEPKWSKQLLSNNSVCMWFYILAVLNAVLAVAGVLIALTSKSRGLTLSLLLGTLGFVNAWFLFLVCSRGLHEGFAPVMDPRGPMPPVLDPRASRPGRVGPPNGGTPLGALCKLPFTTTLMATCSEPHEAPQYTM